MKKVMLVEDEEFILQGIRYIIDWEEIAMEVTSMAHNGKEALEMFRQEPADIVVTDVEMPLMNGLDLLEEIRKISPRTRFLILSGYDEFEYARKALKLDVEEYILKRIKILEMTILMKDLCTCGKPTICSAGTGGAHLPDAGIFRPVYLCYVKNASLENVYIRQRQEKDDWMLDFEIRKKEEKKGDYQIQVSALSPPGKSFRDLAFSGWDRHSQDPGSPAVVGQWSGRSAFISDPGNALPERRTGRLLGEKDRSSENDGEKGKRSVGGKLCP